MQNSLLPPSLDLRDISQMRATITVEIESSQSWEYVDYYSRSNGSSDAAAPHSAQRNSPWILGPLPLVLRPSGKETLFESI